MAFEEDDKDLPPTPSIGEATEFVLPLPTEASQPMSLMNMLNASHHSSANGSPPLRIQTPQHSYVSDPPLAMPPSPPSQLSPYWVQPAPIPILTPVSPSNATYMPNNSKDEDIKNKKSFFLKPQTYLETTLKTPSEESRPRGWMRNRKYCCCFKHRKNAYICGLISLILIIIMIVLAVLYYPRSPQFRVLSLKTLRSGGQVPLKFIRNDPRDPLNFTLTFDLTMNVSFYNDNRYKIDVDQLDLSAYLVPNITMLRGSNLGGTENLKPGATVPSRRVGFSKRNDLSFPSYRNTTFLMNVTLFYAPDPKTGLFGDIIFAEFYQACGLAKTPKRRMRIEYTIGIEIPFFMSLGMKPSFSGDSGIECPFEQGEMDRIIAQLGANSLTGPSAAASTPSGTSDGESSED